MWDEFFFNKFLKQTNVKQFFKPEHPCMCLYILIRINDLTLLFFSFFTMKCFLVVLVMTLARIALNEAAKWKCKYLLNKEKCTRSAKTASNLICFARFNVTMYLSIKAYKTKHKKNIKINFRLQGRNENKYVLIYLFLSQSFTTIINGKKTK